MFNGKPEENQHKVDHIEATFETEKEKELNYHNRKGDIKEYLCWRKEINIYYMTGILIPRNSCEQPIFRLLVSQFQFLF